MNSLYLLFGSTEVGLPLIRGRRPLPFFGRHWLETLWFLGFEFLLALVIVMSRIFPLDKYYSTPDFQVEVALHFLQMRSPIQELKNSS